MGAPRIFLESIESVEIFPLSHPASIMNQPSDIAHFGRFMHRLTRREIVILDVESDSSIWECFDCVEQVKPIPNGIWNLTLGAPSELPLC